MDNGLDQRPGTIDREAIASALHAWRTGADLIEHPALAGDRAAYERAVAAVLRDLDRFDAVADLASHYLSARPAVARAAAAAGRRAGGSRELLAAVVVDTAFWRRCRALVRAAVG
jgi:hypothetical protein